MAEEITIDVGGLHAGLHEELTEMLGDQYDETIRQETENVIHETYRRVERQQEQIEEDEDVDLGEDE